MNLTNELLNRAPKSFPIEYLTSKKKIKKLVY